MANPLATARQLWRLNKDGMLVVMSSTPISATEADAAIKQGVELNSLLDGDGVEAAREEHAEG